MIDVFLSYASADRARVRPLVTALEHEGYSVWWDRSIRPGTSFDREIEAALDVARCVIVVWSRASVESDWVRAEAMEGLQRGVLLPVSFEGARPPLLFRRTQSISIDASNAGLTSLLEAVARYVRAPARQPDAVRFATRSDRDHGVPRSPRNNLPSLLPTLIGREQELEELRSVIEDNRLTTIVGPGGAGKTRLALRAAEMAAPMFAGGVWLVDLGPEGRSSELLAAVMRTVTIAPVPGLQPLDALVDRFRYRPTLLVFDNCEHLIDAAGDLIDRLLAACDELKIIATSREPLRTRIERVFPLGPLATRPMGNHISAAGALFMDRARAEGATLQQLDAERGAIETLCARLDGLPLAIELAASRARALGCQRLLELLSERFRVLEHGRHGANPRHQTLRSAIDWSYGLLSESERSLFNRVSVFTGPFVLADAIAVTRGPDADDIDIANGLAALVDKSMVVAAGDRAATYRLLETLRAYGAEHLAEAELKTLRRRHAEHFSTKAAGARGEVVGPNHVAVIDLMVAQIGEYRAATAWALSTGDLDLAVRVAAGFCGASYFRIGYDALDWLPADAAAPSATSHATLLLGLLARRAVFSGDPVRGRELAAQAVENDPGPDSVQARAQLALATRDGDEALRWAQSVIDLAASANDILGLLLGLLVAGPIFDRLGRVEETLETGRRLLELADHRDSEHARGWGELMLGIGLQHSDPDQSRYHLGVAHRLGRSEKNTYLQLNALGYELAAHLASDSARAAASAARGMLLELQAASDSGFFTRRVLGQIVGFLAGHDLQTACRLEGYLSRFTGTSRERGVPHGLVSKLGSETADRLRAAGLHLNADEAIETALAALDAIGQKA